MDSLHKLRSLISENPIMFGRIAAALWSRAGRQTNFDDLAWAGEFWSSEAQVVLWDALVAVGALQAGILHERLLHTFIGLLIKEPTSNSVDFVNVVWTLPRAHPADNYGRQTLLEACNHVITTAERKIFLMSPFLEERGILLLSHSLQAAIARGVRITILGHDLHDVSSVQSVAVEVLRRFAQNQPGTIDIHSAFLPSSVPRREHAILHSKLIIADGIEAIVSSANLTIWGLAENFETGVHIKGDAVAELENLCNLLIESSLSSRVARV